jgi:hypothetical protein
VAVFNLKVYLHFIHDSLDSFQSTDGKFLFVHTSDGSDCEVMNGHGIEKKKANDKRESENETVKSFVLPLLLFSWSGAHSG